MIADKFTQPFGAETSDKGVTFVLNDYEGVMLEVKYSFVNYVFAGFILERTLTRQEIGELASVAGMRLQVLSTYKEFNLVGLMLNMKLDMAKSILEKIVEKLKTMNINVLTNNIFSDKEKDAYFDFLFNFNQFKFKGLKLPVNKEDLEKRMKYNEAVEKEKESNFTHAIVLAFVGSVLGAIPAFLALFMGGFMHFLLYLPIPIVSVFLYKRAKGPSKPLATILVSVFTLVIVVGMILFAYSSLALYENMTLSQLLNQEGIMAEFVSNMLFSLLGACFAIYASFRYINLSGNKESI
ncbi:hypothetical protein [Acholeplasma hippikon]|uniref:Uncharacterized protein n=1 Tax=Acholeplasma hippikon TaxID=264636 RepID=A0A449BIB3_9MOLU|nr:hypothetical protein [Acholeplasma hippikon]VEU82153.1 Uncharacterised protein [Acholeplasma hippikon]